MQDSWLELGDEAPVSKATNFKRAWRCNMLEEVLVVEECWNMRILTSEAKFAMQDRWEEEMRLVSKVPNLKCGN